jgi:hypothetical protein
VSAPALIGLAFSSTTGLLGWKEAVLRPSVVVAIGSELLAVAALAPLALRAPFRPAIRRAPRAAAAVGLVAVAVLHLAAAGEEWTDARPVFWLFMALAAACGALALRLAMGRDRWTWAAVCTFAVLPLAGYLLSRTTGLPGDRTDVGEWGDPLGLAALVVEAALLPLAVTRLRMVAPGLRSGERAPAARPAGARPPAAAQSLSRSA